MCACRPLIGQQETPGTADCASLAESLQKKKEKTNIAPCRAAVQESSTVLSFAMDEPRQTVTFFLLNTVKYSILVLRFLLFGFVKV